MAKKVYKHPEGHVFYRKMGYSRPKIAYGDGIYLYDTNGKQYIDGSGGPLVVNVGHGRQEIVEAMQQQAVKAGYIHATMFTSEPLENYAQELAQIVSIPDPRFYFLSSGSEVVEAGVKLARQIQGARGEKGRDIIISRKMSYHGMTLGALGVSGRPGLRNPYASWLQQNPKIETPYVYRMPASGAQLAAQLEHTIHQYGADKIAAFLAEPISGASLGAAMPPDDYWPEIRTICDKYGVLLIADEVLTGMGRTGKWWGLDRWRVTPDIMVTSKGSASGYFPLGFVAAKGEDVNLIQRHLGDFNHGGTFSHHAIGAAAGLATLNILQKENLVENAAINGLYLGHQLKKALSALPNVGDIRGRGMFWGIELVADKATKKPFPAADHLAWKVWKTAFADGLIIYYSQGCADGLDGDVLMVGPPYIITPSQIDDLVSKLKSSIEKCMPE